LVGLPSALTLPKHTVDEIDELFLAASQQFENQAEVFNHLFL